MQRQLTVCSGNIPLIPFKEGQCCHLSPRILIQKRRELAQSLLIVASPAGDKNQGIRANPDLKEDVTAVADDCQEAGLLLQRVLKGQ